MERHKVWSPTAVANDPEMNTKESLAVFHTLMSDTYVDILDPNPKPKRC